MPSSPVSPSRQAASIDNLNVADRLTLITERIPMAVSVACPGHGDVAGQNSYATCTFAELERDASALARGFVEIGVKPQMRIVLLVKPGIEFVKLVFALLRSGATTVLIDPGMGKQHLLDCLAAVEPRGFVAISAAQAARVVYRKRFPQAKLNVTVGRRWFWGGSTYKQLLERGRQSRAILPSTQPHDAAAIIFTSGSTGPPKGVFYTHEIFETQVAEIEREYNLQPGGTDLSCFALFGLFNSALGITTVFPEMNFSRPAAADPRKLLAAANDWQITQAFASPAVWNKLSQFCLDQGVRIPTLRSIFSCGAPVPAAVLERTLGIAGEFAEMHTPYGATESLPVATIAASEVLSETASQTARGKGVCVGRKFDSIEWKIIRITDEPIVDDSEIEELKQGEIGELIVRGPQVSPAYVTGDSDKHNKLAKIADERAGSSSTPNNAAPPTPVNPNVWHRMGDVGYFDTEGRFWYCGRKNHRVKTASSTLFTECVEAVFNESASVLRTALVGIGPHNSQTPVLVYESRSPAPSSEECERIGEDLAGIAIGSKLAISHFLRHNQFPIDVRHNSKINREELAQWAAKDLARDNKR